MNSDGGTRAISGFLFQVLVGGAMRAAGECDGLQKTDSADLDALIELARTGQVIHEFADEDLMLRRKVVDPTGIASDEATLVQVKFSALGTAKPIGAAELGDIIEALATATRRIKNAGVRATGYALVTNRKVSPGEPALKNKLTRSIYQKLQKVEDAGMSIWYDQLIRFARRFGQRDDEIEAGRQRLLGLIFEATTSGAAQGEITRDDLLRCLCGDARAKELIAAPQAEVMQTQVRSFDADVLRQPVRRERLASIDADCTGRAIVIFAGPGGSGKTAALYDWAEQLAARAGVDPESPLVALRPARGLPDEWLAEAVREWNPALRPDNANEALERLQVAGRGLVPLVHLALDGADEYPTDFANVRCVQRLVEWFWRQDEAAAKGAPLSARLVITCRNAEEFSHDYLMLRRSGGALADGHKPLVIEFDRFSEAELRELLEKNFPGFERKLLRNDNAEDALLSALTGADFSTVPTVAGAPRHPLTELLLDPVMWRSFCLVDDDTRASLVGGNSDMERELARHFCTRFIEKARTRTEFPRTTIETALSAIAAANRSEGRRFRGIGQWQHPAHESAGLSPVSAIHLKVEAASGGLIREVAGNRWDWRSDAVEFHLASLFPS
jgi:hypothetical protein